MEGLGIFSGADLAARDGVWLATHFGNSAEWLHNLARGIDHRRVKSNRPLKSLGGAYAVLAYVAQEAVETYGWLQPGEMLDGLGMAATTPGPPIMVTQFVGFLAAFRD